MPNALPAPVPIFAVQVPLMIPALGMLAANPAVLGAAGLGAGVAVGAASALATGAGGALLGGVTGALTAGALQNRNGPRSNY